MRIHSSEKDYRALPIWSWSSAKLSLDCPAEAYDQRARPIETTDAMRVGTMIHAAALEPDVFASDYSVVPPIERDEYGKRWTWDGADASYRTQAEAREAQAATFAGELITAELHADILRRAPRFVGGEREIAMRGSIDGCDAKGKLDLLLDGIVYDLKTVSDATPQGVQRASIQRGWLGQVWTYGELARQSGLEVRGFGIVIVQSPKVSGNPLGLSGSRQPRVHSRILHLSADAVAYGEAEARRVWRTIRDCEATGIWPDWPDGELELPRWASISAVEEEVY